MARARSTPQGSALPAGSGTRTGGRAPRARLSHRLGYAGYDGHGDAFAHQTSLHCRPARPSAASLCASVFRLRGRRRQSTCQ
eukprot:177795-Alexandrium_andersonii.AAC.1